MVNHLFQESVSTFIEQRLRDAKDQANQLTLQQLQEPELTAALEKIATFKFEVASLKPDLRKGKRRTEKQRRMDYGREIIIDVDIIDVIIPFEGWPKSFHLAPSVCRIIEVPAATNKDNAIVVSFLDDQGRNCRELDHRCYKLRNSSQTSAFNKHMKEASATKPAVSRSSEIWCG